jgi:hypothetical protein
MKCPKDITVHTHNLTTKRKEEEEEEEEEENILLRWSKPCRCNTNHCQHNTQSSCSQNNAFNKAIARRNQLRPHLGFSPLKV